MEKKELVDVSIIALQETPEERSTDFCPKTFDDYLGQKELKENYTFLPSSKNAARST